MPHCSTAQEKWDALATSTKRAAKQVLPNRGRSTADCFAENEHEIRPELERRNHMLRTWLSSRSEGDRTKFVRQRSKVQKLIRRIKNEWFQRKAVEIEIAVSRSRSAWKSIRDLQRACGELRPSVPRVVKDENREVCKSPEEHQE